jgi:hypothetical protein
VRHARQLGGEEHHQQTGQDQAKHDPGTLCARAVWPVRPRSHRLDDDSSASCRQEPHAFGEQGDPFRRSPAIVVR